MPRLASDTYAAYHDSVLKLATKKGGVSRPQIMEALNVTRSIADTMIQRCELTVERREGRTEFFVKPGTATPAAVVTVLGKSAPAADVPPLAEKDVDVLPPEVEEAGVVEPNPLDRLADVVETDDQVVAALDREITDTRTAVRETAVRTGKAMGEWAIQQALLDTLREKLQDLTARRLSLSQ